MHKYEFLEHSTQFLYSLFSLCLQEHFQPRHISCLLDLKYLYLSLSSHCLWLCLLYIELIKSVHVYQGAKEEEKRWVEREYRFSPTSCIEVVPRPLFLGMKEKPSFREGQPVGLWLCIMAFDSSVGLSTPMVPPILSFSRNPRLESVPTLARDLQKVFQMLCGEDNELPLNSTSERTSTEEEDEISYSRRPTCYEDQFIHSSGTMQQELLENQQCNNVVTDTKQSRKRRRAATQHVASISLTDLSRYFNLTIAEASKRLKVGITVLKRKCREFGIPRWPHRKIKSLDTLIQNLQVEATQQEGKNEAAAVKAVTRRQRMLENEKEGIEMRPFMELQGETRKFRQDVFRRRHRAKALSKV